GGTLIPGATGASFTPTVSGAYTVLVTANGCTSLVSNTINVTITGLGKDQAAWQTSVYPNPSTGSFIVTLPAGKTFDLTVTDLTGRIVKQQTSQGKTTEANLTSMAKGVYLLKVVNEGNSAIHKLVIHQSDHPVFIFS